MNYSATEEKKTTLCESKKADIKTEECPDDFKGLGMALLAEFAVLALWGAPMVAEMIYWMLGEEMLNILKMFYAALALFGIYEVERGRRLMTRVMLLLFGGGAVCGLSYIMFQAANPLSRDAAGALLKFFILFAFGYLFVLRRIFFAEAENERKMLH